MSQIVSFQLRVRRKSRVTPANPETLLNLSIPATKQDQYRQVGLWEGLKRFRGGIGEMSQRPFSL